MLTRAATLLSLILPALALATHRQPIEERAGAAFGEVLAGAPISNITVRADNVNQCQTATISWTGATDPVSLYIALGGLYVGETPITTLSDLYGGSTTWLVNQPAGKTMEFRVTDAKGAVAYVQNVKVGQGDSSCLSGASSASSSTAAASETWSPAATSATWSEETWSSATSTSQAVQGDAEATSTDQAARTTAASSTSTSKTSSPPTTVSTRSNTPSTTFASFTPPSVSSATTSVTGNASIANAGAAASASRTGGASQRIGSNAGVAVALFSCLIALGTSL